MSLVGKIFSVLCLVLAVFYTGIIAGLLTYQENYKRQFIDTVQKNKDFVAKKDASIADLEGKKQVLDGRVADLLARVARVEGENGDLRREWAASASALQYAKSIIDDEEAHINSLDTDRGKIHNDLLAAGETIKKREGEITELKGTIATTVKRRDELSDLLTEREKQLVNAEKELARVAETLKDRTDKLELLFQKFPQDWKQIMEAKGGAAIVPENVVIRAKVVGVDKKLGLVILNAGQKQGVKNGYPFIIFRGSEYVGKVLVQDVTTPDTCAARYVKELMRSDPEVGDDAATRLMVEF